MSVKSYWYTNFYKQIYAASPAYGGWKASGGDSFKVALCGPAYTPNQDTHASLADIIQVSGQGYTAGGQVLTGKTISISTGSLVLEANPATWAGCVFTVRYAVIYDDTNATAVTKQLVRWLDFGQNVQLTGQTLTITFNGDGDLIVTPPPDTTPPQLADASVDGPNLTLSYDEQLDTTSVPATSAYVVSVNGSPVTVSTVAISSLKVTLVLAAAVVAADIVLVSYTVPASAKVRDLAFNPAAALTSTSVFNATTPPPPPPPPPDVTPPVVTITSPLNGAVVSDTITVTVTATDTNGIVSVVLYVDGVSFSTDTVSPYSFGLDTKTLVNGAHTLVARAIDPSGNIGVSSTINITVSNVAPPPPDTTPPSVTITSPLANAYLAGTATIAVTATDNVGVVSATLYVDGVSQGVDPTQPYSFALNTALFTDTVHQLVVTAIDAAGNVGTSVTVPVNIDNTTPVLSSPLINGASLVLNYNETLNAASVPLTSAFTVKTDGNTRSINSVSISGVQVLISLAVPVLAANVVTVSYTAPTGTGATPIEDRAGNNAANLTNQAVTNVTPGDTTAPTITSLTVNAASLVIQYSENLDTTSVPAAAAFAITVNGVARTVNTVAISAASVTLTLASAVISTDTVVAAYTQPATGKIRDIGQNNAASFFNLPVTNITAAPPVDSAAFVSQSIPSLTMVTNGTQNVSVTMKNDGTSTWTAAAGYNLYNLQTIPTILLDDFATLRNNGSGAPVWSPYIAPDRQQTGSLENGSFRMDVANLAGNGLDFQFIPYNGGYTFPTGFAQSFIKSGVWSANVNRLSFWVKPSINVARRTDGGSLMEFGTYIKSHTDPDTSTQGAHYYHIMDPNWYANRWMLITLNRHPQHQVSADPNINYPDNPTSPTVNYFDGLTRFYFESEGSGFQGSTWWFDQFAFDTVTGEPDTLVSSIGAVYTGSRYEATWAGPKNTTQVYDVNYSTSSMKVGGFSSGTSGGTATNPGSAYTGTIWQSPIMAENSVGLYIAIRPQGQSAFTEVFLPPTPAGLGSTSWGVSQVTVPSSTLPNSNAAFSFPITAPTTPGAYGFQWRMRHTLTEFGAASTVQSISVTSPAPSGFFVSTTGSDSSPTGSITAPFRTLAKAFSVVQPSGSVQIRGGTYLEGITNNCPGGTSWTNAITVQAYQNEPVILKPNVGTNFVIWLQGAIRKYIQFRDLVLDGVNVGFNVVKLDRPTTGTDSANHIRLYNCELKNSKFQAMLVVFASDFNEFQKLSIHNCGKTLDSDGLYGYAMYIKGSNNTVEDCDIYDQGSSGIQIFSTTGASEPPNFNTIRRCKIHNNCVLSAAQGRGAGITIASGSQTLVYNNLIYVNFRGISCSNTFTNKMYNNTIVSNPDIGLYLENGGSHSARNNICYLNGTNFIDSSGGSTTTPNLIGVNPNFVSGPTSAYYLGAGSNPAVNTGATLTEFSNDFDLNPRPFGSAWDQGAYERQS